MQEHSPSYISLKIRPQIVKVLRENLFHKHELSASDRMVLSEKYKSIIDNISGFILICNNTTGTYEYISEGVYTNLGYDLRNYSNDKLTEFMLSIIHSDHLSYMANSLLPTVFKYFKEYSTHSTGTDYRYTCSFKLKNRK